MFTPRWRQTQGLRQYQRVGWVERGETHRSHKIAGLAALNPPYTPISEGALKASRSSLRQMRVLREYLRASVAGSRRMIASGVMPAPSLSKTSATGIRVPRITGFPPIISGLASIRSGSSGRIGRPHAPGDFGALLPLDDADVRPSRTAVSTVIARRPLRISVIRPEGTPISRARRLAPSLRAVNSRFSKRPGCTIGAMCSTSATPDKSTRQLPPPQTPSDPQKTPAASCSGRFARPSSAPVRISSAAAASRWDRPSASASGWP